MSLVHAKSDLAGDGAVAAVLAVDIVPAVLAVAVVAAAEGVPLVAVAAEAVETDSFFRKGGFQTRPYLTSC
jgi:hypothetical protein